MRRTQAVNTWALMRYSDTEQARLTCPNYSPLFRRIQIEIASTVNVLRQ
jgi:hypothetical protein